MKCEMFGFALCAHPVAGWGGWGLLGKSGGYQRHDGRGTTFHRLDALPLTGAVSSPDRPGANG